jgi:hypothetical protein
VTRPPSPHYFISLTYKQESAFTYLRPLFLPVIADVHYNNVCLVTGPRHAVCLPLEQACQLVAGGPQAPLRSLHAPHVRPKSLTFNSL